VWDNAVFLEFRVGLKFSNGELFTFVGDFSVSMKALGFATVTNIGSSTGIV